MKKIILSLVLAFCFLAGSSQQPPPIAQRSGPSVTVADYNLFALRNFRGPVFADTAAANAANALDSCGRTIYTYNVASLWVRQCSPKRWVKMLMPVDTLMQWWGMKGDLSTDPTKNFIGTLDSTDLVFKTTGREQMRLSAAGVLEIGRPVSIIDPLGVSATFISKSTLGGVVIQGGDVWWNIAHTGETAVMYGLDGEVKMGAYSNNSLSFEVNNLTKMQLNTSGQLFLPGPISNMNDFSPDSLGSPIYFRWGEINSFGTINSRCLTYSTDDRVLLSVGGIKVLVAGINHGTGGVPSPYGAIGTYTNNIFIIKANNQPVMIFDSTGVVGLGTQFATYPFTPDAKFQVENIIGQQTVDYTVFHADDSLSSFVTTSADRVSVIAKIVNTSTRLTGGHNLYNYGAYISASGAQFNYALLVNNGSVGINNLTPTSRFDLKASFAGAISTIVTTTTLDDTYFTVLVNANSGAVTVNLPSAATCPGRIYTAKKIDASANAVTLDGFGSETIDGSTTVATITQYAAFRIQSDGINWYKLQ